MHTSCVVLLTYEQKTAQSDGQGDSMVETGGSGSYKVIVGFVFLVL